jgi:hypothetical protein
MSPARYQINFTRYSSQGYRLVDISGYMIGSSLKYAAIWEKKGCPAWRAYQTAFTNYTWKGYGSTFIDGFAYRNSSLINVIFEKKAGPAYIAKHGMTSTSYQSNFTNYAGRSYKIKQVSEYSSNGSPRFAAIW